MDSTTYTASSHNTDGFATYVNMQQAPQQQQHGGMGAQVWPYQPQPQVSHPNYVFQQQPQPQLPSTAEIRTLWVGDLQFWMDENYLNACFAHTGELLSISIMRSKQTGQSLGYGFIEFVSHAAAQKILQSYNGIIQMPNAQQLFRLNWASKRPDMGPEYTIFVGDLASDVTDNLLQETFRAYYGSLRAAKVVVDKITGRPKGYGFVTFGDENEQIRAMTEMNGQYCSSRPMRIGPAASKKRGGHENQYDADHDNDPNNTTIFVGSLDPSVTCETLKELFSQCGEVVNVKIPVGKGCGFVQFSSRTSAEQALARMGGTTLGQRVIRLSWGRNSLNKQQQEQAQQFAGWSQPQQTYAVHNQWNGSDMGHGYAQPNPNVNGYGFFTREANHQQGNYSGAS